MVVKNATAKFDLTMALQERGEEIQGSLEYSTDLFDEARIACLLQHFEVLLQGIVANPEQRLWALPLLRAEEETRAVVEWNATQQEYPFESSVSELFERQVTLRPSAVAVVSGQEELSYAELNERANQLAHYLKAAGVQEEECVGVCLGRGVEMIIALLGVLKAGAAYVPLDPDYPASRLNLMLADAEVRVLITKETLSAHLGDFSGRTVYLDREEDLIRQESRGNLESTGGGERLAYAMYTSGSTGQPKGSGIPHRAINRLVLGTNYVQLGPADRVGHVSTVSFDAATFELWGALLNGARLVVVEKDVALSAPEFGQVLREQEISAMFLTSALFNRLVQEGGGEIFRGMKHLMVGGEALDAHWIRTVLEQGGPERLLNGYGPTESTTFAAWEEIESVAAGASSIPIGRPVGNTTLYVLDQWQQIVPVGVRGEIYIGGDGLARGYLNDAVKTAERFVPHPYHVGERLYRTGDEGCYLADGRIEYLGRRDQQVKVRGFRIELGEIEAVLVSHAGVQQAVVTVSAQQQLVGYVVGLAGSEREVAAELKGYLRERLPEYMVPQRWVVLEQIPLTANGKVDRRALPKPSEAGALEPEGDGEWTPVEEMVAGIWSEVLKRGAVARDENFFELGGHSLLATQVISRVRQVFGVEVALRRLFEQPTLRGFSQCIEAALHAEAGQTMPVLCELTAEQRENWGGKLPLSFAQQRLWFLDQLEPGSASYNIPMAVRLKGELNVAALERTLSEIVQRHEVLRTRFVNVDGAPRQQVWEAEPIKLAVTEIHAPDREAVVREMVTAEASEPFDLSRDLMLRVKLLRLSDQEHVVLMTMHHIASDGWSMGVLIKEVATLYEAYSQGGEATLGALPVQYSDFAVWQRGWLQDEELEQQLSYWRVQLGGELPVLELPTDRARPAVPGYRGAYAGLRLPTDLSVGLKDLSRREGVTLFMTLLAAFQTLLHRYSGQDDIVVGSPVAGRNQPETEGLIGFFVNTLALRAGMGGEPTFVGLLQRVKEVCLGAYAHQDVPFEKLVEELQPDRDTSRTPLFQVMFALQNAPREQLQLPGLELSRVGGNNATAKFDLTLALQERGEEIQGSLEYSTDLFDEARIARLLQHFEVLLQGIVANPEQRLWELPLLRAEEETRAVVEWNATQQEYPFESSVSELFERQVTLRPEAVAVVSGQEELSYAELNERANQLAHYLKAAGVQEEECIGVCLGRGVEMIIALLGVLKAGAAYVPLDPDYPANRLNLMLADAEVQVLITKEMLSAHLGEFSGTTVYLDREAGEIGNASRSNLESSGGGERLAYAMYTSGSTGQPKGSGIPHRAINRLVLGTNYVQVGPEDRVAHVSTVSFDAATFELWGALLNGARLVVVEKEVALSAPEFGQVLREQQISAMFLTTSLFNRLAQEGGGEIFRGMKHLMVGGEALDAHWIRTVLEQGGPERLLNGYGPTESTTFAAWEEIESVAAGASSIPIGRPVGNTTLYVLDQWQQVVPVGVRGEIYIGGDGLARGYLNDAVKTAERFVPHPYSVGERLYRTGDEGCYLADGRIEYLGRRDQQVKVRGFRIELGEIEAVLVSHTSVQQAVVTVSAQQQLVGYVVGLEGSEREVAAELKGYLRERLPEYMVPQRWVVLEQIPLTANGKVDRRALPKPSEAGALEPEGEGEWTPVEEMVAGIWSEVLKRGAVARDENFFELGGHSLLATQVISRVRQVFGVEVALRRLFEQPTLRGFSQCIDEQMRAGAGVTVPALEPLSAAERDQLGGGMLPLSFAQQRLWFLDQLEPGSASYNMPMAVRLRGELHVEALEQTLSEIVRRHEVLRTRFVNVDGEPRQEVLEAAPVALPVEDLSELDDAQREAAVREAVGTESREPFDLGHGPLLRVKLLRLSEQEHVVLLTMHHIVSDGWSMGLLIKEVASLYVAYSEGLESTLPELTVQYGDFAVWQRGWLQGAELERQLTYWREQLSELPVLELPADRARPAVQNYDGAGRRFTLDRETTAQLKELSQREGVTLFMTLLAAFQTLLARYSGQNDIVVGTPIAGRTRHEIEPLIGFFVNTLVLRSKIDTDESFRELLAQVREVCLGAYAHQEVPFEKLVEELQPERDLSRSPLFQAMFALQNAGEDSALELPGLTLSGVGGEGVTAKFDISADFSEDRQGRLHCVLVYATSLFTEATIARMGQHLQLLLEAVAESVDQNLGAIEILSEAEQTQLRQWSTAVPVHVPDKCVHELFAAQAARTPDAIAVINGEKEITYRELNERANQLAHYLRRLGVSAEQVVGLCVGRSAEMLVGMLGTLKAGGAYVPLDPSYPRERQQFMLAQAGVKVLLTEQRLAEEFADTGVKLVCLDTAALDQESKAELDCTVRGANVAYVIYTSGSTGTPKGVMIPHAALTNFSNVISSVYDIAERDRILQFNSISFDTSVEEIYTALLRGACLVLRNDEMLSTPEEFLRQCGLQGITVLDLPTAYWHELVASGAAKQLPESVRLLIIGGEKARRERVRQWHEEVNGHVRLINSYGPTEATVGATVGELTDEAEGREVKIGRALSNVELHVLDQRQRPVPVGIAGELYIGGAGLARGYIGRAEETAERFVPHPYSAHGGERLYRTGDLVRYLESGELEYVGRRDDQVKLRGYRIELGEIETVLESHPLVQQAVVTVREEQWLVGYVVGMEGSEREVAAELRSYLRERLPDYMVPQRWVMLDQLPLTTSGKIDRRRLPAPSGAGAGEQEQEAASEWTPVEELVAGIWSEVLKLATVGRDENFFELGGHSLLATQVISRVRQAFGVEIGLRRLFEEPTVRRLAHSIGDQLRAGAGVTVPALRRFGVEEREQWSGVLPLSFAQQRLWFLDQLEPGSTSYNMPMAVRLHGNLNVPALEQTLTEIVRRHEVLRTRFVNVDDEPRQEVLEAEDVKLAITDLSSLDQEEREAAVREAATVESSEPFDLANGPMLRVKLLRLSDEEHVVLLTMHHIAGDGWSMGVLTREVATLYAAYSQGEESTLAELPVQYGDFAVWQRGWLQGAELERQLAYWREQLGGELPVLELPADRPRPAMQSYRGAHTGFRLSPEVSAGLKELSRREGVTLFMTLLAAFQTLLHRYSGQDDVVVGSPVAGRNYAETEGLIGFFVNTLALRADMRDEPTFVEFVKRVKEACLGAYAHQDVPFEKLVEELQPERDLSRSPLFQTMFILQNTSRQQLELPGLKLSGVGGENATAKFDLTLAIQEKR